MLRLTGQNCSWDYLVRFVLSYGLVAALAYWFEYFRHSYRVGIERRTRALVEEIKERVKIQKEREKLIEELQEALEKVRTLSGLLPICAHCKKVRDDKGYWSQIEKYIQEHSEARFSHGICPECAKELYPELELGKDKT